ncbi:MAG: helix-turn-helix transcriptional regulator [Nanoarchaeota archaeon]
MEEQDAVNKAQYQLLRAYIERLETHFSQSDTQRRHILHSLDKLVGGLALNKQCLLFDYTEARKVRNSSGLTLRELAEKLGIRSPQTIGNYEKGIVNPSTGSHGSKYLSWLEQARDTKALQA